MHLFECIRVQELPLPKESLVDFGEVGFFTNAIPVRPNYFNLTVDDFSRAVFVYQEPSS